MNALAPQGRFHDALAELEHARELDPASFAISVSRGIIGLYARDFEGAVAQLEAVEERHPRFALVHYFLTQCHAALGELDESLEHGRRALDLSDRSPETLAVHGYALGVSGEHAQAVEVLERLGALSDRRYVSRALLAQVALGLGRDDEALTHLERAGEERATDLVWLGVRPMYDRLRGSERFDALLGRLGLLRA
jgi:tetratricopeptide (TPR) repeat protein